jgi:hypothetical protein
MCTPPFTPRNCIVRDCAVYVHYCDADTTQCAVQNDHTVLCSGRVLQCGRLPAAHKRQPQHRQRFSSGATRHVQHECAHHSVVERHDRILRRAHVEAVRSEQCVCVCVCVRVRVRVCVIDRRQRERQKQPASQQASKPARQTDRRTDRQTDR